MKKGIILLLCYFVTMAVQAAKVKESEARSKAQHFIEKRSVRAKSLKRTAHVEPSCGAFYVFNMEDDGGFVIVSADDRTEAVLGYADSGSFDTERQPSHVRAWLQGYADQIAVLRSGRAQPLKAAQAAELHEAITPLLTTRWDQDAPYNLQCPPGCVTGCVATAMAQVMRYHRWPEGETTEIPAYETNSTIGTLDALPPTTFDWDLMADTYNAHSTDEEQQAVARLMRYCGQAVKMDYGTISGAQTPPVAAALRTYFGYDVNTRCVDRNAYTARTWDRLIYQELAARRPVVYTGGSTGGAHAFVCDGYDGNGFYHINWGWGGMSNGYYRLSVLNPSSGGIGSSGTTDGFAMDQQAVVGIQKTTGSTDRDDLRILSLYNMWASGTQLCLQLANVTGLTGTFMLGFAYHKPTESTLHILYRTAEVIPDTYSEVYVDIATLGLEDGTYRFYPYSRLEESDDMEHIYGDYSVYMEVVVEHGTYQFAKHPISSLTLEGVECTSNKVVGLSQEVKVTISNSDGDEFNQKIYLFASQSDEKGSAVSRTTMVIEKGGKEEASLFFTPNAVGKWHLWIGVSEDEASAVGPYDVTVMAATTASTNLALESFDVVFERGNTVKARLKNNGAQGYYRPVICALYSGEGDDFGEYRTQLNSGNMDLSPRQSADVEFNFEAVTPGRKYLAILYAYRNHSDDEQFQVGNLVEFTARDPYSKTIVLTVNDTTRVYGDENPVFTYVASGAEELIGTPELSCKATKKSAVGSYPITISRGTVTNANLEMVNGTLTVTKAPLIITCESYVIKQGEALPAFKMKADGFKNGDTSKALSTMPTVHCDATQGCEPGEYAITASGGQSKNYDISYVDGVLTVLPADPIIITANSYTREYGDKNPVFAFTSEGAALQGQPEIICEATPTSPVGTYPIVIREGSVSNYNVTYVDGTLTVESAQLTITAESYEIEMGDELPQFGFTAEGFKNGEDTSVLTRQPVVSCQATQGCEPGEYPITVSGAEAKNYDISYVAGMLTVKIPLSIAAMTAAGIPFDVYNLEGQLVRRQTTTLKGLPRGHYVVHHSVVFVSGQ